MARPARLPVRPAPASFGRAGISAGEGRFYKGRIRDEALAADGDGWPDAVSRGLGWFSIALGLAEITAPQRMACWLGMEDKENAIQLYGLREIGTGVGLLTRDRTTDRSGWLWGRVAGDALDMATLAPGLRRDNPRRGAVLLALGAVGGVLALDMVTAAMLSDR